MNRPIKPRVPISLETGCALPGKSGFNFKNLHLDYEFSKLIINNEITLVAAVILYSKDWFKKKSPMFKCWLRYNQYTKIKKTVAKDVFG